MDWASVKIDQDFQRPHENLCIRGVAHISNYNCRWVDDNNISGIFDRQSLAQLEYYSNPLDAYEANVESFTKLNLPFEKIIGRRSSRARDEGFKKATPFSPLFVPHWGNRDPSDVLLLGGEQTPPAGGELTPQVAAGGEQTPHSRCRCAANACWRQQIRLGERPKRWRHGLGLGSGPG